jgi:hypothetical protein
MAIDIIKEKIIMQPVSDVIQTSSPIAQASVANSASLVSNLPPGALFSPAFQPLMATVNPAQDNSAPAQPLPFQVSQAQSQLVQDPQQFSASLQSASQGLGGLLDSLDTAGTSDQVNQLIQSAQDAASKGDGLTAQKDMAQAQLLYTTMSTVLNMISQMQLEAIRNSKLQ